MSAEKELELLRNIVGELTARGTSSWESSIRCLGCGAYTGGMDPHTPRCPFAAWQQLKWEAQRAREEIE